MSSSSLSHPPCSLLSISEHRRGNIIELIEFARSLTSVLVHISVHSYKRILCYANTTIYVAMYKLTSDEIRWSVLSRRYRIPASQVIRRNASAKERQSTQNYPKEDELMTHNCVQTWRSLPKLIPLRFRSHVNVQHHQSSSRCY